MDPRSKYIMSLVKRLIRRLLVRKAKSLLAAFAVLLMLTTWAVWTLRPPFALPGFAAIVALLPAAMSLNRTQGESGRASAGLHWLVGFALVILAVQLPSIRADYVALRRSELCFHAATVWLQNEHGPASRHRVTCR